MVALASVSANRPPQPGELVCARVAAFVRSLRANGFAIGLAESHDALRMFCAIDPSNKAMLLAGLRALFASRQSDWDKFDAIFNAFWFSHGTKNATRLEDRQQSSPRNPPDDASGDSARQSAAETRSETQHKHGEPPPSGGVDRQGGAAAQEALSKKDFRHILKQDELERTYALADRLAAQMRTRQTRRDRAAKHGQRLDFRRVIHRSISRGGTPIELVFRRRKTKPLRLVMLLDTSGSMSAYTPVFVRFMHGVLGAFKYAATFLFHTRLVDVTGAMTDRDPQRAIDRFSLMAEGVGGGTKIGESLAAFNAHHAKRVIRSRTAIIIISDGYDTGEPEVLGKEMAALRRRCRRIVWLNPMAGWTNYTPEAGGMKAAMPFVELFAPAHNLESLEALEPYLAKL